MFADLFVAIFHVTNPDTNPPECANYAAMSELSSGLYYKPAAAQLYKLGWPRCSEGQTRSRITVELPPEVHFGEFLFAGNHHYGLYTDADPNVGTGHPVYARIEIPALVYGAPTEENCRAAIHAAVESGITLSIYQANGMRKDVPVSVLSEEPADL